MRVFEILILVTLFVRFVGYSFFSIRSSRWIGFIPSLTILLTVIHLVWEKFRLQMVPAYGLTLLLFLLSIRQFQRGGQSQAKELPNKVLISLRFLVRLLIFTAIATLPILIPVFHLPEPTGQFQIGTTTLYLVDNTRSEIFTPNPDDHREVIVRVWYPAQIMTGDKAAPLMEHPPFQFSHLSLVKTHAYQDAPVSNAQSIYPVLIFSHGHVGFMEQNLTLMEELASHGYIVCSIAHTYQAIIAVFPNGRVVPADSALANDFLHGKPPTQAINAEHLRVWTEDTRFLIDELERIQAGERESLLVGKLDMDRLGIFGQSFGGVTAAKVCIVDDRCQAGISLDSGLPSDYTGSSANPPLKQPFMFMLNEVVGFYRSGILGKLNNTTYAVAVRGTTHFNFTDLVLYSPVLKFTNEFGSIEGDRMAKIINAYAVAFWDEYLNSEISPLLDGPSPDFPEVIIEVTKP
jgi:predicted dienelactone hydrolase